MAIKLINGELLQIIKNGTGQNVVITVSSTQSTVIGLATTPASPVLVRITGTDNFRYVSGTNPTALSTSPLLMAGVLEYIEINNGDKIAVIQEGTPTGAGLCSITPAIID